MADVTLTRLTKSYDNVVAVDAIDLKIVDKEFVVLVGPSGCGKSTTLRMIAGLETPDSGEIHIGQKLVNDVPPKDRNIAMVFQNYALYPHMNVRGNLSFGLKMRGISKNEIDRRVEWSASILGIKNLLDRKPKQLSGGQRQRVAVGRAIVREPQAFLLDEPLSNLDAKLRVQMRGELIKLHHRLEATMIYVTHDQTEAMSMGDRIVIMKDGAIQQVGAPMDVYNHPVNQFVAGFIGSLSMNFLDGVIADCDAGPVIAFDQFRVPVPAAARDTACARIGRAVTVGVRPEHVYIGAAAGGAASTAGPLAAQVEVHEPMGSTVILELSSPIGGLIAQVDPNTGARARDHVEVHFDVDRLHLFDPMTKESLS